MPSNGDSSVLKAKAIEVISTGASMIFRGNLAVQQVIRPKMWASQITLISFYLKDVTKVTDAFFIGPMVAALEVV